MLMLLRSVFITWRIKRNQVKLFPRVQSREQGKHIPERSEEAQKGRVCELRTGGKPKQPRRPRASHEGLDHAP